ncbi:MAG: hypothetical protein ACFFEY_05525 [Candidatus Thorarchaeota archaeon]
MDIKTFKKTFKFICNDCEEFAHTNTEYCEKCGAKSLRTATKEDYDKYQEKAVAYHKVTKKKHDESKKVAKKFKKPK